MQAHLENGPRIVRMAHVIERTGLSKSSILALIANGTFPRPFTLAPKGRSVGWLEADVSAYILSRREAAKEES